MATTINLHVIEFSIGLVSSNSNDNDVVNIWDALTVKRIIG